MPAETAGIYVKKKKKKKKKEREREKKKKKKRGKEREKGGKIRNRVASRCISRAYSPEKKNTSNDESNLIVYADRLPDAPLARI